MADDPRGLQSHFDGLIGTEWLSDDPDGARARVPIRDDLRQPFGLMHGGVMSSLVESVCSRATALAVYGDGMAAMGQSISVSFMRPGHLRPRRGPGKGPPPRPHDLGLGGRGRRRRGAALRPRADDDRRQAYSPKRLVIGSLRSRPKARGVMRMPGAAWRRLYSEWSTMRTTSSTTSPGIPAATISSRPSSRST